MTKRRTLLLLLFLYLFVPARIVFADTGPKPTMEFTFTGEAVTVVSGVLYECDQYDCSAAAPLEEVGPQGFRCEADRCSAVGYSFANFHKIEIEFSDGKTRLSNIFETVGFESEYTVTVRPEDLLVEEHFSLFPVLSLTNLTLLCIPGFCIGALLILVIIFLLRRRKS
jgi:hypothetical protein